MELPRFGSEWIVNRQDSQSAADLPAPQEIGVDPVTELETHRISQSGEWKSTGHVPKRNILLRTRRHFNTVRAQIPALSPAIGVSSRLSRGVGAHRKLYFSFPHLSAVRFASPLTTGDFQRRCQARRVLNSGSRMPGFRVNDTFLHFVSNVSQDSEQHNRQGCPRKQSEKVRNVVSQLSIVTLTTGLISSFNP
jgi:hypothetical protein